MNEKLQTLTYIGSSAPIAASTVSFGFDASHVRVRNDSAENFYYSLAGTATTSSMRIGSSEDLYLQQLPNGARQVSLISTSSSTGGFVIRIGAWD